MLSLFPVHLDTFFSTISTIDLIRPKEKKKKEDFRDLKIPVTIKSG